MDTDSGRRIKVVCRYRVLRCLQNHRPPAFGKTPELARRRLGTPRVTAKSLTTGLRRARPRAAADLVTSKFFLVNDRVDLEEQLSGTAKLIGGKVNVIESTAQLARTLPLPPPTSTW
ncbi:MAG: hypothetical protein R3F37_12745 [Candidatus Competibacteraceae bacterium]